MTRDLAGATLVMSGGSRGIGLATALAFARRGGNVALLAKTDEPHPALPGTIHTAVDADVLRARGVSDFSGDGGESPTRDIFVD